MGKLRKKPYSLGVIPFNKISGNGYLGMKAIAKQSGIQRLVTINIEGERFEED